MRVDEKRSSNSCSQHAHTQTHTHTHTDSKREDKGRNNEILGGYDQFLAPHVKSLKSTAPF